MKLKNKKTGKIIYNARLFTGTGMEIHSLKQLTDEWVDYDDTKDHWCVSFYGEVKQISKYADSDDIAQCKKIGNYFETREETEKAVEKLKAWKRLKDKGFHFLWWISAPDGNHIDFYVNTDEWNRECSSDLDLLFGGEE